MTPYCFSLYFFIIIKLLEKLDLNFHRLEAKGKVNREKWMSLVKVGTLDKPHSSTPFICFFSPEISS